MRTRIPCFTFFRCATLPCHKHLDIAGWKPTPRNCCGTVSRPCHVGEHVPVGRPAHNVRNPFRERCGASWSAFWHGHLSCVALAMPVFFISICRVEQLPCFTLFRCGCFKSTPGVLPDAHHWQSQCHTSIRALSLQLKDESKAHSPPHPCPEGQRGEAFFHRLCACGTGFASGLPPHHGIRHWHGQCHTRQILLPKGRPKCFTAFPERVQHVSPGHR